MVLDKQKKAKLVSDRYPFAQLNFIDDAMDAAIMGAVYRAGEDPRVLYSLEACKFLKAQSDVGYMERLRAIEGFLTVSLRPSPLFLIKPPSHVFRHIVKEYKLSTWEMLGDAAVGVALEGATPIALVYNPSKALECLIESQIDSDEEVENPKRQARQTLDTKIMAAKLGPTTPFFLDHLGLQ